MAAITLIRPPTLVPRMSYVGVTCPPLGMMYIASSLEERGHRVHAIDAVGEEIFQMLPVRENDKLLSHGLSVDQILERIPDDTDIFGFSVMFSHEWPQVATMIAAIRRKFPAQTMVLGGEHATAVPEYSLESCPALDYCVLGEGEDTMVDLVEALAGGRDPASVPGIARRAGGRPTRNALRGRKRNLHEIPLPNWDLVPLHNYLDNGLGFGVHRGRSMPIAATRGCPYQCTFCSNPTMWTTTWLPRKPEEVIAEMKLYIKKFGAQNFDFYDLTAIVRKDWIQAFATRLIEENLNITWQLPSGTRSEAIDWDVAPLLYRSGCRNLSYAPESGSPAVLKRIKKHVKLDRMISSMRACIKNGLNLKANIIFGFPGEKHSEIWQTMLFLVRMAWAGVHDVSISTFVPYPGSELFRALQAKGKIDIRDPQYFVGLAGYSDVANTSSFSDGLSNRALGWYRLLGTAVFYGLQFLFRPVRLWRLIRNMFTRRHESRLEMCLQDLVDRLRLEKGKAVHQRASKPESAKRPPQESPPQRELAAKLAAK